MTEFKIAKIISDTTVVITGGTTQGIKESEEFTIYGKSDEEVTNPDTGEVLGTLDVIKGKIKVIAVYEHMSVCENVERTNLNTPQIDNSFGQFVRIKPLNVDRAQITGGYSPTATPLIKIGDLAIRSK
ncbi:MAG: hypothetical protein ABS862_01455 [Carnobacterium inhibens]|uniref:hypothetical protein n=1 Tax=Carnobacterium sp. TaxID=48221 RepID=UPI003315306B